MKKILFIVTMVMGIIGFASVVKAHHLNVSGTSSCVREDGSWDWSASYTIPNEDWAIGLTVVVTWDPAQSGTTTADYVYVTAHGQWSNGNTGGGSTKIWKGEKCPVDTTTTTTVPEQTTTTTTTVPEDITTTTTEPETSTTTTTTVVTTTSAPVTTTSSPPLTENPSTTVPTSQTVPGTPTTTVAPPINELPPTGLKSDLAFGALAVLILGGAMVFIQKYGR